MTTITILHVEDEPSDRMIVAAAFRKAAPHIRLVAVNDGEQAILYLEGQDPYQDRERHPFPRLVVLDIKLPRKSGLEVLEWIRSRPEMKTLPVFMMTSSSEPSDLERATALGANAYLVKTVELAAMRETVRGIGEFATLMATRPAPERLST